MTNKLLMVLLLMIFSSNVFSYNQSLQGKIYSIHTNLSDVIDTKDGTLYQRGVCFKYEYNGGVSDYTCTWVPTEEHPNYNILRKNHEATEASLMQAYIKDAYIDMWVNKNSSKSQYDELLNLTIHTTLPSSEPTSDLDGKVNICIYNKGIYTLKVTNIMTGTSHNILSDEKLKYYYPNFTHLEGGALFGTNIFNVEVVDLQKELTKFELGPNDTLITTGTADINGFHIQRETCPS
ncbi:hypothetical protein [Vibrio maritimus]|uniref:hypothetical protein n=1 Tax=Vibrio maritimus TaxID=990268 RepID=UPI001F1FF48D|nr:hypothetical protein [Vibrio maritimus]